ncbi:MAG: alpha,alpha-trehalase TreF [Ramlibacter sp.]|nr:alpha,alpha-trehalase TreF [Ramlibacter sp.]
MAPHFTEQRQAAASQCPPADDRTPADRYQELFVAVQRERVFADSKSFVDCIPLAEPAAILSAYRTEREDPGFKLLDFVHRFFRAPDFAPHEYVSAPGQTLAAHIDALWPVLTRTPRAHPVRGSLLPLPHPYVVPGGRFDELYYWDSYFTMLGLADSGCADLLDSMTDNFAYLIETYGHVPNGTRTYYLSRSQPPVFALMTELSEAHGGQRALHYLPQLRKEHEYWMDGAEGLRPGEASRRVVALTGGGWLNRYWDDRDTPREESWREDVATAAESGRPVAEVYRDLRAAAESGWDFSSRWLREPRESMAAGESLATICTTRLLPVDLNAFMHKLECTIARLSRETGDGAAAEAFGQAAMSRQAAMNRLMWNPAQGAYFDWDWRDARQRQCLTAATVVPLFTGTASRAQAAGVADAVRGRLLAPGGLGTTEWASGQQWDRPNGWAPLQWMAACGLENYGISALAREIRARWLETVSRVYERESKLVEKYTVRNVASEPPMGGGGGEYPLQDGFGWTNGVTRPWLERPGSTAAHSRRTRKR